MHITFAGSSKFSKIVLQNLLKDKKINAVVTAKDKPKGRGQKKKPTPVKKLAKENNINVFHNLSEVLLKTDLVTVAAYGKIISKEELEKPKYGFLNVHPSLLPNYRGPTPIQSAILNGNKKTGVTIMFMDEKIDHGPLLNQKEINLAGDEYYLELEEKLAKIGGQLLSKTITQWIKEEIEPIPQNHKKATHTSLLSKKDGEIDWSKSARQIERKMRAYNPWPGSYSYLNGKLFKILKADIQKQTEDGPFGEPGKTFLGTNKKIAVQTGDDFLLIKKLQLEGGKKMTSEEFLRGNMDLIGSILGQ